MSVVERIIDFFATIGEGAEKVQRASIEVLDNISIGRAKSEEVNIQERLKRIKEIQSQLDATKKEEAHAEDELLEELIRERRQERNKNALVRLGESLMNVFKKNNINVSSEKTQKSLKDKLWRANINMTPEVYIMTTIAAGLIGALFGGAFVGILFGPSSALLGAGLGLLLVSGYMWIYPSMRAKARVYSVEKNLPFALRHMASLLSAGVGITEALVSVSKADYGALSEEFAYMIGEMRSGRSFQDALQLLDKKLDSEKFSRFVSQVMRAYKYGGELSRVLYDLANEFSLEYRMKLVEYVQKLNGLSFIYLFASVVMPTMSLVGILAGSVMAKTLILPAETLRMIIIAVFPMMAGLFVFVMKSGEPR